MRADAPGLARTVGAHAAVLPELLADLPPGSEQLALQMLYVLTGALTCTGILHCSLVHALALLCTCWELSC